MAIHRLEPKIYYYTLGPHEPALHIHSGDTVVAETLDAFNYDARRNLLPDSYRQRAPGSSLHESNPLVGPVYVEEAKVGDLLAVHIRRIRVNRDFALTRQNTHFGSLTGEGPGRRLLYNPPVPMIWYEWQLDLDRNVGILELPESRVKRVEAPLLPFIGSIGLAPRFGRIETSLTPGEFGGNMDCPDTREGATLFLPVWVNGAYLFYGDVHALQGDGEVNGVALEVTAEVTLDIEVRKNVQADWPRLEDDNHIMVAGSTRPLDDCVRLAQMELLRWLVDEFGFKREDAWQLNAQVGSMRIGNVVDPCYTVVAKFPKAYLP